MCSVCFVFSKLSSYFQLHRGTRRGALCPLLSLVYQLVKKFTKYFCWRCSPVSHQARDSIPAVLELFGCFTQFSGYKINFSKSEALPLCGLRLTNISPPLYCPFRWTPQGFTFLGIAITPSLHQLYAANFTPFSNVYMKTLNGGLPCHYQC